MENPTENDVVSPPPRWKTLLALPKNQRSGQQSNVPEVILMQDFQAQDSLMSTMVMQPPQLKNTKKFPFFIIGISVIQIMLMNMMDYIKLLYIFGYDPYRRHELWRLVTIMLVHNGSLHLWPNVIFQLILGIPLEIVHHWKRIAIIYLSSVVGASLFISVLSPQKYAAGASAGGYGLLLSHLSTMILNWNEMNLRCCRLFWLLAFIIFDIWSTIYIALDNDSQAGHCGSAIFGFLVSILVLKNFKSQPWEDKMQKICFGILSVLVVTIVLINIFAWVPYEPTEWNFNYEKTFDIYYKKIITESSDDLDYRQLIDQYEY